MDVFLVVGLSAALFLALELRLSGRADTLADDAPVEWTLFSPSFVRLRLAALAEELERLDRDPAMFARAHHTKAAKAAYDALLADVSRLDQRPPPRTGTVVEAERTVVARDVDEVLDL